MSTFCSFASCLKTISMSFAIQTLDTYILLLILNHQHGEPRSPLVYSTGPLDGIHVHAQTFKHDFEHLFTRLDSFPPFFHLLLS